MVEPISTNRMLVITPEQAHAVADEARARILEILYRRNLTVDQIAAELREAGFNKAITTVRHHIRVLRDTGLIEVTQIDEVRGTISKQYGTGVRLLNYECDGDFDQEYKKIIHATATKMDKILGSIESHIPRPKGGEQSESYYHYLAVEVLNRAVTAALEPPETKD